MDPFSETKGLSEDPDGLSSVRRGPDAAIGIVLPNREASHYVQLGLGETGMESDLDAVPCG
jgi:hypothetical protein